MNLCVVYSSIDALLPLLLVPYSKYLLCILIQNRFLISNTVNIFLMFEHFTQNVVGLIYLKTSFRTNYW